MKKPTIIILLFLIISNGINAQFSLSAFPEIVNTLDNICFYNDKIFLVNADPNTLLTLDGGKNLIKINSPGYYNNAVAINDSTFIVSLYNRFKLTYNRGISWNDRFRISDNNDTIKNSNMYDFYIYKNGQGFITNYLNNYKPQVFTTKNWGQTWNIIDSNKTYFSIKDVGLGNSPKQYNFDSTSYILKNNSRRILVKYMNYGDSISEIDLTEKGIIQKVYHIAFKDENNGMILTVYSSTETQNIYITNDGCKTFTEITKPSENFSKIEYAKATINKEAFYIASFVTSATAGTGGSYYTKDNGKTWYKNLDNNNLRSMDFYDAENGIVTIGRDVNFKTNIFYFTGNTTNIREMDNMLNKINIYPNPVNNTLNYSGLKGTVSYKIFNIQGQLLLNGTSLTNQIDVSELQNGLYILNLETEKGTFISKFIKQE